MLQEKINKLSEEIIDGRKVGEILEGVKKFNEKLIESIFIKIAIDFNNEKISFEKANTVSNNLYSYWISNDFAIENAFGDKSFEIFNAFDIGEYKSVEKYVKPKIKEILLKIKAK